MIKKNYKPNRQIQRTKSWIFDALIILMDEMPFQKITISDICEKAGIARPTFYRYYGDKEDVLFEYIAKTINTELLNIEKKDEKQNTVITLMFDYKYMLKYKSILKKILSNADIDRRISLETQKFPISLLEHYRKTLSKEEYFICRYKLCYQITGSLRVFFDWFINDMPMPVESVVSMINAMNIPKTIQYRNIPSIVVQIT